GLSERLLSRRLPVLLLLILLLFIFWPPQNIDAFEDDPSRRSLQGHLADLVLLDRHDLPGLFGPLLARRQLALVEPDEGAEPEDQDQEDQQRARAHRLTSSGGRRRPCRARSPGRGGTGAPSDRGSGAGSPTG